MADLADRWSLRVGEPFQPGGQCWWTAPVTDPVGVGLVLKVGFRFSWALAAVCRAVQTLAENPATPTMTVRLTPMAAAATVGSTPGAYAQPD